MFSKDLLTKLYSKEGHSSAEIASAQKCSISKVNYWLKRFAIPKRTIAEALYKRHNPKGDPFLPVEPRTVEDAFLFGLGVGLYWGEGTKSSLTSVRLGNTDPRLIIKFLEFLKSCYKIKQDKLRFGLQVFNDMSARRAKAYWQKELRISSDQFQKVIITPSRSIGTYRNKSKYGVLTVYFHNKKLRNILCSVVEKI